MPLDEARAVAVVADLLQKLDDANPDVGMGPSRSSLVRQAREMLGVDIATVSNHDAAVAAASRDKVVGELKLAVEKALTIGAFAGERLPAKVWREEYAPVLSSALDAAKRHR